MSRNAKVKLEKKEAQFFLLIGSWNIA